MRRMSANNHRGQEVKIFHKQAGYMRAMIFSHINDRCLAKRSGSIYAGEGREQDAEASRRNRAGDGAPAAGLIAMPGSIRHIRYEQYKR